MPEVAADHRLQVLRELRGSGVDELTLRRERMVTLALATVVAVGVWCIAAVVLHYKYCSVSVALETQLLEGVGPARNASEAWG